MRLVVEVGQELRVALSRREALESRPLSSRRLHTLDLEMLSVSLPHDVEVAIESPRLGGGELEYLLVGRQVLLRSRRCLWRVRSACSHRCLHLLCICGRSHFLVEVCFDLWRWRLPLAVLEFLASSRLYYLRLFRWLDLLLRVGAPLSHGCLLTLLLCLVLLSSPLAHAFAR